MDQLGAFADEVLVQEFVEGPIEHAQAVFSRGRLIGMHVYRQIVRGAGGGPALKESVRRPMVREHLRSSDGISIGTVRCRSIMCWSAMIVRNISTVIRGWSSP